MKLNLLGIALFIALLLSAGAPYADAASAPLEPDSECPVFREGPPVGLACIHCAHPRAHTQAMALAALMRESCRKRLVTNYLIDGRFGLDDDFIVNHIRTLAENRRLMVILYLTNGPSQRRGDKSVRTAFGSGMKPPEFRTRILSDQRLRQSYKNIVQRAMWIKSQSPDHVRFLFVPGLEDNMTDDVFRSVISLTKEVSGDTVEYGRSACVGCYAGNSSGVPSGVMKEAHSDNNNHGVRQGVVTNDGDPFYFASERSNGSIPLAKLNLAEEAGKQNGNAFIFWTSKYQGISVKKGKLSGRIHPDKRNYAMPTSAERREWLEALQ